MVAGGNSAIISRRQELAADGGQEPLGLPAEEGLAQRRCRPLHRGCPGGRLHRHPRRPRRRPGRPVEPGRPRRPGRQPARSALGLQEHGAARTMPGSISSCTGRRSNRGAIGAQVRLFWNGQEQLQEVSGGCGYSAQNQRRLHFGLGKAPRIEKAVIRWPSGSRSNDRGPRHRAGSPARGAPMTTTTSNQPRSGAARPPGDAAS